MRLRHKIAGATLLLVSVSLIAMAIALSYKSECAPAPPLPDDATLINAIVFRCYGPPEVLKLEVIAKPLPADDELLVKVRAAAVNPLDWHRMISQADGAALKALVSPNVTVRQKAVLPLQLDSALDSDVVFHEYGHGLSWRMIGGMDGPLAGAIGEGNSDGIAMLINGDDRLGEYSGSSPLGIRRAPYAGYPLTYGDVTGAEVHNDGEIYAAAIWRLIELFPTRRDVLFRYVVEGMELRFIRGR